MNRNKIRILFCQRLLLPAAAVAMLGGCSTTSFAPPPVPIGKKLVGTETCSARNQFTNIAELKNTVEGAQELINLNIFIYDCAMRQAADGRQAFEIPAYLGSLGTAAAVVFGAGSDVLIAGGINSAAMNRGKSYFDPERKAEIYLQAKIAMRCIQTESVGVPAFDSQFESKAADRTNTAQSTITLTPSEQYYIMIAAALGAVNDVAARRLRGVGSFDPAGLQAEIIKLSTEVREADAAKKAGAKTEVPASPPVGTAPPPPVGTAPPPPVGTAPPPPVGTAPPGDMTDAQNGTEGQSVPPASVPGTLVQSPAPVSITPELRLGAMQPRLNLCVAQSKL